MDAFDLVIIGAGPAGLTAALYGARARAETVVFERGLPGGQIVTTEWVENYPGFPEGIAGVRLGEVMTKQAERFGAEVRSFCEVEALQPCAGGFLVNVDDEDVAAKCVIVATGAVPKKLLIPGEAEFTGRGVSWCAMCDGALFLDRDVCVIGGGDSALQEALYLAKIARRVHLIHRRDQFRAARCIQERCLQNERIELHLGRIPLEIVGKDGKVRAVRLRCEADGTEETVPLDGVFIFVGTEPKSEIVSTLVELDESGFVKADFAGRTSMPGLFVAGDVANGELKQVITAAARGAEAASGALRHLEAIACDP